MKTTGFQIVGVIGLAFAPVLFAQFPGPPPGPPKPAKAIAPIELTGYWVSIVSEDFFRVMSVQSALGRLFAPGENRYGGPALAV